MSKKPRTIYIRKSPDAPPEVIERAIELFSDYVRNVTPEPMPTNYVDPESRAIADLCPMPELWTDAVPNSYLITRINVPINERGKGYGSRILRRILADADARRVTLYLQPISSGHWTNRTLQNWYRRAGFVNTRDGYWTRVPALVNE